MSIYNPVAPLVVNQPGMTGILGYRLAADMNVTTDQAIAILATRYQISQILAKNASISLTTAVGGVYSAAAKGGTAIVAAAQVYSALTAAGLLLPLTVAALGLGTAWTASNLYLSLTVAQGAAATMDVIVLGTWLP